jgi:hypothetical protein
MSFIKEMQKKFKDEKYFIYPKKPMERPLISFQSRITKMYI